jgi:hypothetical protein
LILFFSLTLSNLWGQAPNEKLLSTENAYNPIPSPNGKMIAYVRTGWGRPGGSGGFGRSNLVSEVMVMSDDGKPITATPLTDTFLTGWTPDGSALIYYRDWRYGLVTLTGKKSLEGELRQPERPEDVVPAERVFYSSKLKELAWSRVGANSKMVVIETKDRIIAKHTWWPGDVLVPSPNERYIAVFGNARPTNLWVYDTQLLTWSDLGPLTVHPDSEWDYMKATWNPWFADSSHLVYFSGSTLVISEPNGNAKRTIPINRPAGLATPSPDGKFVAYLTFDPRPRNVRPDLKFWGGSILWILALADGGEATPVTEKNSDTTYDLRWLGNDALVFDRFADAVFPKQVRIWKVSVRGSSGLKSENTE